MIYSRFPSRFSDDNNHEVLIKASQQIITFTDEGQRRRKALINLRNIHAI